MNFPHYEYGVLLVGSIYKGSASVIVSNDIGTVSLIVPEALESELLYTIRNTPFHSSSKRQDILIRLAFYTMTSYSLKYLPAKKFPASLRRGKINRSWLL
jgi:hypothetical protein